MRRRLAWAVILTAIVPQVCFAMPVVWTGFDFEFTRPPGINATHPQYRDVIAPSVAFARGASAGLFNITAESGFSATSPAGTRWATNLILGNATLTIAATNWQQLNFSDWNSAYGGSGNLLQNIASRNAVVHVVAEDVYFDIRFITWENGRTGGMGGFSYERAAAPTLLGDHDFDGDVDGRDLLAWQRGESPTPFGAGDLAAWQSEYNAGSLVASFTAAEAASPVPEPGGLCLLTGFGLWGALRKRMRVFSGRSASH